MAKLTATFLSSNAFLHNSNTTFSFSIYVAKLCYRYDVGRTFSTTLIMCVHVAIQIKTVELITKC